MAFATLGVSGIWFSGTADSHAESQLIAPDTSRQYVTKSIQDIREGDVVLSRDEHGDAVDLKRVVETYERTSDHLRILMFVDQCGNQQTLKTTDEHPFWVVDTNAWIEAKDLDTGDRFTGPNGELQRLVSTVYEPHPEGIAVYILVEIDLSGNQFSYVPQALLCLPAIKRIDMTNNPLHTNAISAAKAMGKSDLEIMS